MQDGCQLARGVQDDICHLERIHSWHECNANGELLGIVQLGGAIDGAEQLYRHDFRRGGMADSNTENDRLFMNGKVELYDLHEWQRMTLGGG